MSGENWLVITVFGEKWQDYVRQAIQGKSNLYFSIENCIVR